MFDVDIDVATFTNKKKYGTRGIIFNDEKDIIREHPSAFYISTNMPIDGVTGNAAIEYEEAEELGFIKVDLLTNTAYDGFNNKAEVLRALHTEPNWDMLKSKEFVKELPHVGNWYDLLQDFLPRSIEELADFLALIRPGKQHLIDKYHKNSNKVRDILYKNEGTGMYFKKSHAIAYAAMIVCIMNKRCNKKKSVLNF